MAGGNILCVNEFIPDAVETYLANYPKTKMLSKDIRKTSQAKPNDHGNIGNYQRCERAALEQPRVYNSRIKKNHEPPRRLYFNRAVQQEGGKDWANGPAARDHGVGKTYS